MARQCGNTILRTSSLPVLVFSRRRLRSRVRVDVDEKISIPLIHSLSPSTKSNLRILLSSPRTILRKNNFLGRITSSTPAATTWTDILRRFASYPFHPDPGKKKEMEEQGRDFEISENSSISTTPKSPQGKYPHTGYKMTSPNTKPRSSNKKHNHDFTSRKTKLTTHPFPKESQLSLPSALVSFLRSFFQCTFQIAHQRIATAPNRDRLSFFIQCTVSILQTILVPIVQFVLHTIETFIKFIILLHKLSVGEVLASLLGSFATHFVHCIHKSSVT